MRKLFPFVLSIVFLLCIVVPQVVTGQDFANLPDEMKGAITLENSTGKACALPDDDGFRYYAKYLTIYYTDVIDDKLNIYWAVIHKQTGKPVSAGYMKPGGPGSCKHWNYVDGAWVTTTCRSEVLWDRENDVAQN